MTTEPLPAEETLLVLCSANVVRSPLAAAILRRHLHTSGRSDLRTESAGLQAASGTPVSAEAVRAALEHGVDLTHHRPRAASPEMLAGAALVVTMTEAQRTAAERLTRGMISRTFTLRELVRLAQRRSDAGTTWSDLARTAHSRRPLLAPAAAPEDVPDPVGRDLAYHQMVAADVADLCERVAMLLEPLPSTPTP